MARKDSVRPSRAGDQFHYHWAACQCLELLPGRSDLVAVAIEGASVDEAEQGSIDAGEHLIDVGLYYGSEKRKDARLVRYIQLKHSTDCVQQAFTASFLGHTIRGFAQRYAELLKKYSARDIANRFRFEFVTNRLIKPYLGEALADLQLGDAPRHPEEQEKLIRHTGLGKTDAKRFLSLFSVEDGEADLWLQRTMLLQGLAGYLPGVDYDAPVQLKDLVTRKATSEFANNPSIRRLDVLGALNTDEEELQPAPCLITAPEKTNTFPREQEAEIREAVLAADNPVMIHADGGVGKSVLAARLAHTMPAGSEAVLYDCFGDGYYRNPQSFRHRYKDALVQIANELAARGLCQPLIPTVHADSTSYMRAFCKRLTQAVNVVRTSSSGACLCLIIDAADNAEIAAEEQHEAGSFARGLIRASLPDGVRLVYTSRTHRRERINAPPNTQEIELRPFSESETAHLLRTYHPSANDTQVQEFAVLSSWNPRVQDLALSRGLSLEETLKLLGPAPTTVDQVIEELLEGAVKDLRDNAGLVDATQIDLICQGLAILRPLVPIPVLAKLSRTPEAAVRSFVLDLSPSLLLKGDCVHFRDEPTETWFQDHFQPTQANLTSFLERLRPITAESPYAAAVFPELLLQAGELNELVELALSGERLPDESPLDKRDVELRRLIFALKACLDQERYKEAAKIALKAGGECAGEQRQNDLIQENTDLAAELMDSDRIEAMVSRRTFSTTWMGSHHAYYAGLMAGQDELLAQASSHLRMAVDWVFHWARLPDEERRRHGERVSPADIAEIASAKLRVEGPSAAASYLRRWRPRLHSLEVGSLLGKRLIDLGQDGPLNALAEAAGNDIWLLLGLASEARAAGQLLPAEPMTRLMRLLADRRVDLSEFQHWDMRWKVLDAVRSAIEIALRVMTPKFEAWASVLQRYLPSTPPFELASHFNFDAGLLHAYALDAALRGESLAPIDIAPTDVRKQLEQESRYGDTQQTETFRKQVKGLLPWVTLSAEINCGRAPEDLAGAIQSAIDETSSAEARRYPHDNGIWQTVALEWLRILCDAGASKPAVDAFRSWRADRKEPLWPNTLISLCWLAGRADGFEPLAIELAGDAFQLLNASRENAESRADSYLSLARAILVVNPHEARVYFDRAVEITSRIGNENIDRWEALLHLAEAAKDRDGSCPETAHRLSRAAELTYEYVARDKHFDWNRTVEALTGLCGPSCLAILSRWRDRRFGHAPRLLPVAVYRLMQQDRLPPITPIALSGVNAWWKRIDDMKGAISAQSGPDQRSTVAQVAYRYIRVRPVSGGECAELAELRDAYGFSFPDIDRLLAINGNAGSEEEGGLSFGKPTRERKEPQPDWEGILRSVDLSNPDALRSAYDEIYAHEPPYDFEAFFREAFAQVKAGREPELIRAVSEWPDLSIFDLQHLLRALPSHAMHQMSFQRAVRDAVLSVCRRNPERIHRRGPRSIIPFQKLHAEDLVSDGEVVRATLEGYSRQVDTLDAGDLFHLLDPLAASLSPGEGEEVLNYGLDLLEEMLTPENDDGPWRPELQPPQTSISALAGYIWVGLGSPVASERWEYAHAVRSVVELGWTEMLAELIDCADSGHAGPFADQNLEFYIWHARQSLLIGLARGGMENASALVPASRLLQRWLRENHVVIRAFAAQALQSLVAAGELGAGAVGDLDSVNEPSSSEEFHGGCVDLEEDKATGSAESVGGEDKYYFGLDIRPYWFGPLGRAFGLGEGAVERRARHALRQRMGWEGGGWRFDARQTRGIFGGRETHHSHGGLPKTDDRCAYHGYHAMMMVAAALLEERPVRRLAGESMDEFRDWLLNHLLTRSDGKWLADRRDPCFVKDPSPAEGNDRKLWCWDVTREYLDQQLLTDDDLTVLWGHWQGGDDNHHETVYVRSALVCRSGSESLLAALQTSPQLGRFMLPSADHEQSVEYGDLRLMGWVTDEHFVSKLEEKDPWAEGLHYPGPAPSDDTIATMGLCPSLDERTWTAENDALLRNESWVSEGRIEGEIETFPGSRLSGNQRFLQHLSDAYPESLLILSVEVRRLPPRYGSGKDEYEPAPWPYIRYYIMQSDGTSYAL